MKVVFIISDISTPVDSLFYDMSGSTLFILCVIAANRFFLYMQSWSRHCHWLLPCRNSGYISNCIFTPTIINSYKHALCALEISLKLKLAYCAPRMML